MSKKSNGNLFFSFLHSRPFSTWVGLGLVAASYYIPSRWWFGIGCWLLLLFLIFPSESLFTNGSDVAVIGIFVFISPDDYIAQPIIVTTITYSLLVIQRILGFYAYWDWLSAL